jgi:hypothetical protein
MARPPRFPLSFLRKWRQKYLAKGKEGLTNAYPRVDPQLRVLEEENERLKRIVAKQALELEIKSELLKTPIQPREANAYETVSSSRQSQPALPWLSLPAVYTTTSHRLASQGPNPVRLR